MRLTSRRKWLVQLGAGLTAAKVGLAVAAAATPPSPFALISSADADAVAPADSNPVGYILRWAERRGDRPPNPLPVVHVEGLLPHQGLYDESMAAKRDWPAARDMAIAYRLTGNVIYADRAQTMIKAWAKTYRLSLNPIDETELTDLLIAGDLMDGRIDLGSDYNRFKWSMAAGYLNEIDRLKTETKPKSSSLNNWQSHRVKIATLASFAQGDPTMVARAERAYIEQLTVNLRADGSTYDFVQRDALHYVVYDLEPLALAALAAKMHGLDWYGRVGAHGAGLTQALDWLVPYAAGAKSHEEFVGSTVSFDATRRNAGIPGFGGPFQPVRARALFATAARLDPRYADLSSKLGGVAWLDCVWPIA